MSDNMRGSLFMMLAMIGFTFEDALIKRLAKMGMPIGQILILFGLAGIVIFMGLTLSQKQRLWHPDIVSRPMLIKAGFEISGRLFYTLAVAAMTLSNVSAVLQATPLVVVAGAAILFGEHVGLRRWCAILVGFFGVIMIIRPGMAGFNHDSILAILGLLGFAGRDLAIRAAPKSLSNYQLGIYGFGALIPAGVISLLLYGGALWPSGEMLGYLLLIGLIGTLAYWALTRAMRVGEISVVTPFRYSRLVFALLLGAFLFGDRPDFYTLLGALIVVLAGIYILTTQNKRA